MKTFGKTAISKLTQSQAASVFSHVEKVLQRKYPIIDSSISFISSPPCTSPNLKQQTTQLEIAKFIKAAKDGDFLKVSEMIKTGIDV